MRKHLIIFGLWLLCQPVSGQINPTDPDTLHIQDPIEIYLVRHAWHAGMVLPRSVCDSLLVIKDFPEAEYIEIGWGDADYYREEKPGLWVTFKAALLPTMSTLHIVGLDRSVSSFFPGSDIIQMSITAGNAKKLIIFINQAFALNAQSDPIVLGNGLYDGSHFYKGSEHYYAFKNCNTWVARGLKNAGFSINPMTTLTVNQLIKKAGKYGKVVSAAQ